MSIREFLDLTEKVFWDDLYIICGEVITYHNTPWDTIPDEVFNLELKSFSVEDLHFNIGTLKGGRTVLVINI